MSTLFNEISTYEEMLPKYTHTHTHIYVYIYIYIERESERERERERQTDTHTHTFVFNWNHFEMRLLNLRINFYLSRTFCPHLVFFVLFFFVCCFFFRYVSAKFHLWPSSGDLPRPWIGMMSLVTVSPIITAFHSCCLSHQGIIVRR